MSMPISKECYESIIEQDIKWLDEVHPGSSLEKGHIKAVLRESIEQIYGRGYKIT